MPQANPYDSSLSQSDFNAQQAVGGETSLDIPSMLAQVVGALVKNYSSPQGGMSAGGDYMQQGAAPMLTSGLDEFQQSMKKGQTPNASQGVSGGGYEPAPVPGYPASYGQYA